MLAVSALIASMVFALPASSGAASASSGTGSAADSAAAQQSGSQSRSGGHTLRGIISDQIGGAFGSGTSSTAAGVEQTGATDEGKAAVDGVLSTAGYDYTERALTQRGYRCDTDNAQTVTVMVYMCGADLESQNGAATSDLVEMQDADLSDNINIVIETGGASQWNNDLVDASTNTIWELGTQGFAAVEDVGLRDMNDPSTLQDFIEYAATNYPADRNILVLWDHGGGTLWGYGYDENFPDSASMSATALSSALEGAGVEFDIVGFDACLMGSVGNAFCLEPYADYLIGSERSEPGTGWNYTRWLSELAASPSIPTAQLGMTIVDDFIEQSRQYDPGSSASLSVIDLTKLPGVLSAMDAFFSDALMKLDTDFASFSVDRSAASGGAGAEDDYDMIDLQYLASNMQDIVPSSEQVASAVDDAVVYVSSVSCPTPEYGLDIDFPYHQIEDAPYLLSLYGELGFSRAYSAYLASFVSIMDGGQSAVSSSAGGGVTTVEGNGNTTGDSGIDSLSQDYYSYYSDLGNMLDGDQLAITEKNGGYVLSMSDDQWELITDVTLQLYLDDGYGYADMGTDNRYDFDDDGDLVIDFDGNWYTLDGQPVSFYFSSAVDNGDGTYTFYSTVPALVNDEQANVIVCWDEDNPDGYVQGYQRVYDNNLAARGVISFEEGDTITYMCDCYDYDQNYLGTYNWADPVTYDGSIEVSTQSVEEIDAIVCYKLTDIYGNQYVTEPVQITYS